VLALAVLAGQACSEPLPPDLLGEPVCSELVRGDVADRPNLVIVLNDTMRRDYIGVYGGPKTTPSIDAFAKQHLIFESAFTQAPWTKPAIATLFTSLYPSQHRVASDPQLRRVEDAARAGEILSADVLSEEFDTLAEALQRAGYRTAAFVSNPWMAGRFGFDQGFEVYDDSFAHWGYGGDRVIAAGLEWLDELGAEEPYFLYLHLIDSHRPYGRLPTAGLEARRRRYNDDRLPTGKDALALSQVIQMQDGRSAAQAGFAPTRSLVRAAYRAGIEQFDRAFGVLLERLRAHARWEATALILTSDHGEALYDRGYGNHGSGLYDDEAAIPLIARLPGMAVETKSVECLTGLVDLFPSLCGYLDVGCPRSVQGWSFVSIPGEEAREQTRYLATEGAMDRPAHRSLRNRNYKLLYEPNGSPDQRESSSPWSLFDLRVDAAERFDRTDSRYRTPEFDRAHAHLEKHLATAVDHVPAPAREIVPIESELGDRQKALGYGE
jgi:arylsulfatase A-like enzyme